MRAISSQRLGLVGFAMLRCSRPFSVLRAWAFEGFFRGFQGLACLGVRAIYTRLLGIRDLGLYRFTVQSCPKAGLVSGAPFSGVM